MPTAILTEPAPDARMLARAFESVPYGVVILDAAGIVVEATAAFVREAGPDAIGRTLNDVLGIPEGRDLAALDGDTTVRLADGGAARLRLYPVPGPLRVAALHPAIPARGSGARPPQEPLHIRVLGRCRIEGPGEDRLNGPWLEQRPGQLLRLLVAARGRVVTVDEIADALWPDADAGTASTVRYVVHGLRTQLEPDRAERGRSRFVVAHRGGYRLDTEQVTIDADAFERETRDGLAAHASGGPELARRLLERAVRRYRGDFLVEEPYADWAASERERLREQLGRALRALAELAEARDDLAAAAEHLARLGELEPLDEDVHRALIGLCLRRGRRGEAARRYEALRRRMTAAYGVEPAFALASA